jgi:hypothetical protein
VLGRPYGWWTPARPSSPVEDFEPDWRGAGRPRRHPTRRERTDSSTLQTLQDPILLLPWLCFRGGGFPNPSFIWELGGGLYSHSFTYLEAALLQPSTWVWWGFSLSVSSVSADTRFVWGAIAQAVGVSDSSGDTLHNAAACDDVAEVRRLVAAGANVEQRDAHGVTPLQLAAGYGQADVVTALVQLGADKEIKNAFGETPLHQAAAKGHVEVVRALMEAGAHVGAQMPDGATPLHIAAERGHVEVVTALIELGANIGALDGSRETPLQASIRNGQHQVAQVLRQQAAEQADRVGAEIIEEEEREEAAAAEAKVRGRLPPLPTPRAVGW